MCQRLLLNISIFRYSKNVFFKLTFHIWKVFRLLLLFSISMSCLPVNMFTMFCRPVIFPSSMLLNIEHWLEYFCYLIIRCINIFQAQFLKTCFVSKNCSNADKTDFISLTFRLILTFFINYEFFQIITQRKRSTDLFNTTQST